MGQKNGLHLSESFVAGETDQPLLHKTIGAAFDAAVQRYGDRDALIVRHQNIRFSYRALQAEVDALAAGLLALGLEPGDRIGIWSPNNSEWVITQFATAKAGLILVNINPAYRLSELEYALNKVGCKALITAARFKTSDYLGMLETLLPTLGAAAPGGLTDPKAPDLKTIIRLGKERYAGMFNFDDIVDEGRKASKAGLEDIAASLEPDDAINIQFTSGTTGSPKGATLSHFNILNNGFYTGEMMRFTEADRLCIPVPLYHCFGMVLGNLACITHGAAMIFPDEGFDPLTVLQAVDRESCTALHGVPTMFIAILDHPDFEKYDLSHLRTGIMAGAPCPAEVMRRVIGDMHMDDVTIAYGMTETSPVSFQTRPGDPVEKRVTTVGRIHPHVEVKVVDAEGGIVPPGQQGELLTRGYSVMRGYWNDPERTAESIDSDGWMHTGDLAVLDKDGYCAIVGRVKDMVIRGGENIYPREVEEYLYRHPAVQDVQVFGIPDEKYGEELVAWVIRKPEVETSEEDIRGFCRGHIAHYKIPRYVKFVEAFPMTVTGKPQKFVMRDKMTEELGN